MNNTKLHPTLHRF